jgi:TetR/AcrR family transcriptional regulator, cholesterol catabolism regulator
MREQTDPSQITSQFAFSRSIHERRAVILHLVTSGPRRQTKPDSTGGRVLDAAIAMFAERGFDSCTMRDLAAASGVKAPALYNHFSSKEEILAQAMNVALAEFYVSVLEPLIDEPPESWLEQIVARHTRFQLEHAGAARESRILMENEGMWRHLPPHESSRFRATQREYVRLIRDLVAASAGLADEEATTVASYSIVAMCNWVKTWYRPEGTLTPSDVASHIWQLIQSMLGLGARSSFHESGSTTGTLTSQSGGTVS